MDWNKFEAELEALVLAVNGPKLSPPFKDAITQAAYNLVVAAGRKKEPKLVK